MKNNKNTARKLTAIWTALVLSVCLFTVPAYATGADPLSIVQVGMSIQSHDASQRSQGFLCLFGGLGIAFAREILTAIGVV